MRRTCRICGYVDTDGIAKFCPECGQEFVLPPKAATRERVIAVISYCTLVGLIVSYFLDKQSKFVKLHRRGSIDIQRYTVIIFILFFFAMFISPNNILLPGTTVVSMLICQTVFPLIGIVYAARGISLTFNTIFLNLLDLIDELKNARLK